MTTARIATAPIPNMAPKITANPIASGRPSTREGPIDTRTVDIAVSPPWSETVTITSYIPLEVGVHEKELELADEQPVGRRAYAYVKDPFPPLVETTKVTLCPKSGLAGVALKDMMEGSM